MDYTLYLNAKLQPFIRNDLEDIFEDFLEKHNLGSLTDNVPNSKVIEKTPYCNITFATSSIKELSEEEIITLKEFFIENPVPKDTKIICNETKRLISVGTLEGLGLYINWTDLPNEVYVQNDINDLNEMILEQLGTKVQIMSYSEHENDTALYYYGSSFNDMHNEIKEIISSHPLCEKSKVQQI